MKRVVVNNFARGIADDRFASGPAQYAFAKHFDILSNPNKLQPLRGMQAETQNTNTSIGNMIVASNGSMYGIGLDYPTNPTLGKLWARTGYGGSDIWDSYLSGGVQTQLSGATPAYDFLLDFPDCGHVRSIHWASNNKLVCSDPAAASSVSTTALTFTSIGQGIVHPKDKQLYFPYRDGSSPVKGYIGLIASNATAFTGLNATAFQLPYGYRAYCLASYGNFLAIPLTSVTSLGTGSGYNSLLALWNRDTSTTTFDETIPWGAGNLQVLNNLQGSIVGINTLGANATGAFQDFDAIQIKVWNGGPEPTLVKELRAQHLAGSSHPFVALLPRVNFVYNNRLYFSARIDPNDGIQSSWTGLFSVGRNKTTGEWTVTLERVATNANSETAIIAAAITGDFLSVSYSTDAWNNDPSAWTAFAKTLAYTINGQTAAVTYAATSIYESLVNPAMADGDKPVKKKLGTIAVTCQPLPSSAQIVLKYRVDSNGSTSDWVTAYTYTTAGGVQFEAPNAAGTNFTDGYNYEFRLESTGGAVITSFAYDYDVIKSNL